LDGRLLHPSMHHHSSSRVFLCPPRHPAEEQTI
jgi:hypothetical protein